MNCTLSLSQLLSGTAVVLISSASAATTFTYDFNSETAGDHFESDVVGWSQDTPNPSAFGTTIPFAYIASTNFGGGATNSGHLGTQFANTVDNSSTTVTGALDTSGAVSVPGRVTMNLGIVDNTADQFEGRDAFSFAVFDLASAGLAQINFVPTVGDEDLWDVLVAVNGGSVTSTLANVVALSGYKFQIDFQAAATVFSYGSSESGSADTVFANLAPVTPGGFGEVQVTHNPLAPAGTSANTIVFDDISVVVIPEPSSLLLSLLASSLLLRRRRP